MIKMKIASRQINKSNVFELTEGLQRDKFLHICRKLQWLTDLRKGHASFSGNPVCPSGGFGMKSKSD